MNNEIENNIVPATPDAPVTPDAMTTPVETASQEEIIEQTQTIETVSEAQAEEAAPSAQDVTTDVPAEEVSTDASIPEAASETNIIPEAIPELPTDVAPMEETPVSETPAEGVPTEAVQEAPATDSIQAETPTEVSATPVESAPVTDTPVTTETTTSEEKTKKKSKVPLLIIIGLIGIILGGGWFYYEYFMNNDEKLPPEPEETIINDTPTTTEGIDKDKYTSVKEVKVMVGEEEKTVTYGLTKQNETIDGDYDINIDVYYDTTLLDSYLFTGIPASDELSKYESLIDNTVVSSIKDTTSDVYYLVMPALARVAVADTDYVIEVHPTIYSLDGKMMAVVNTSVYSDGAIYAKDETSKLYKASDYFNGLVRTNYYVDDTSIHYIKPTADNHETADEMAVAVNEGVVSENVVSNIAISETGEIRIDSIGIVVNAE